MDVLVTMPRWCASIIPSVIPSVSPKSSALTRSCFEGLRGTARLPKYFRPPAPGRDA